MKSDDVLLAGPRRARFKRPTMLLHLSRGVFGTVITIEEGETVIISQTPEDREKDSLKFGARLANLRDATYSLIYRDTFHLEWLAEDFHKSWEIIK